MECRIVNIYGIAALPGSGKSTFVKSFFDIENPARNKPLIYQRLCGSKYQKNSLYYHKIDENTILLGNYEVSVKGDIKEQTFTGVDRLGRTYSKQNLLRTFIEDTSIDGGCQYKNIIFESNDLYSEKNLKSFIEPMLTNPNYKFKILFIDIDFNTWCKQWLERNRQLVEADISPQSIKTIQTVLTKYDNILASVEQNYEKRYNLKIVENFKHWRDVASFFIKNGINTSVDLNSFDIDQVEYLDEDSKLQCHIERKKVKKPTLPKQTDIAEDDQCVKNIDDRPIIVEKTSRDTIIQSFGTTNHSNEEILKRVRKMINEDQEFSQKHLGKIGVADLIKERDETRKPKIIYVGKRDLSKCKNLNEWKTYQERKEGLGNELKSRTNNFIERLIHNGEQGNLFSDNIIQVSPNHYTIANQSSYDEDYEILIQDDTDIIDIETGNFIARFRKSVIPEEYAKAGLNYQGVKTYKKHAKGARYEQTTGQAVLVGNIDPRKPTEKCRLTAYTHEHFEEYQNGLPFIQAIDEAYQYLLPLEYYQQWSVANNHTDYVIKLQHNPGEVYQTAFSTITINATLSTALHKDEGDYGGYGNLTILGGNYTGGYTVFPEYGIAINIRPTDFIAMNVHEWHFNTAIELDASAGQNAMRMAFVCYYREKMNQCEKREDVSAFNWNQSVAILMGLDYEEVIKPTFKKYGILGAIKKDILENYIGGKEILGRQGNKYIRVYPLNKKLEDGKIVNGYSVLLYGNNNKILIKWDINKKGQLSKSSEILVNNQYYFDNIGDATYFYLYNSLILPLKQSGYYDYVDEKVLGDVCFQTDLEKEMMLSCVNLKILNPNICNVPIDDCSDDYCSKYQISDIEMQCINKNDMRNTIYKNATLPQKCKFHDEEDCQEDDDCHWQPEDFKCIAKTISKVPAKKTSSRKKKVDSKIDEESQYKISSREEQKLSRAERAQKRSAMK